jgi:tetratricopeptide (TPR) repeat protein
MAIMKKLVPIILFWFALFSADAQYSGQILKIFEQSYVLEKAGDFRKAANIIKEVYQDDSYEMNLRLGWLNYNAGLFEESKAFYRKALLVLPYSEEAKFGIILPLAARGEWDEVIGFYNQILANNHGNTVALYRLGLVYYGRKDWAQAARNFQKVVDLYPFGYDGLLMMAWTNLQLGKSREARILFNKVLLWSPNDPSALEGLGLLK